LTGRKSRTGLLNMKASDRARAADTLSDGLGVVPAVAAALLPSFVRSFLIAIDVEAKADGPPSGIYVSK
jgi:hypothetical protein